MVDHGLIVAMLSYLGRPADETDLRESAYETGLHCRKYHWCLDVVSLCALSQGSQNVVTDVFIECPYGGPIVPIFDRMYYAHCKAFGNPVDSWREESSWGFRFVDSGFAFVLVFGARRWHWRATIDV